MWFGFININHCRCALASFLLPKFTMNGSRMPFSPNLHIDTCACSAIHLTCHCEKWMAKREHSFTECAALAVFSSSIREAVITLDCHR